MTRLLKKLRALIHRRQLEKDLEDELRFHLEMKAENSTTTPFGNTTKFKELMHDMWTFTSLESWLGDIRYGIRSLAKAPGFTAVAIIALALGIGADTAMYTIVEGAFTWNLGLDHRDRIVIITGSNAATHTTDWSASYPDFRDFRDRAKSLEGIAAYQFVTANVSDTGHLPERYWNAQMSANGFRVSEQKPALGRDFLDSDTNVVMLSNRLWIDRYGQDPNILGKTIRVDEVPRTVIGVMPPNRRFPEDVDIWTPLLATEKRDQRNLMMFARLPEKANLATVRAELDTIARALAAQYPASNKDLSASFRPIAEITGIYNMRPVLAVLFGAVGFVLLIACADVANMLLARGAGRTREISIRVAIGAGKARILRQLLIESVLLSIMGGMFGILIAVAGLRWFELGTGDASKPPWLHLELDRNALLYLTAISVATGLLFGLAPALRLARTSIQNVLKDGGPGTTGGRVHMRLANTLVVFQMVLCIVLLAGAGLMIRSASNLFSAPIGANINNVLTTRLSLPAAKYRQPADWFAFLLTAKERLQSLPGVTREAIASNTPQGGWSTFDAELQSDVAANRIDAIVASADYFGVLEIKPVAGRTFTDTEAAVVVNQSFATKYWPSETALGKHIRLVQNHASQEWLTIAGVIPDVLQSFRNPLDRQPLVYIPFSKHPSPQTYILARTQVPPTTLAQPLRLEIQKIDENLALFDTRSLENRIDQNRLSTRIFGAICTVFASIALILAIVGLYSVIAHSASMRSQEIGLRMAMGGTQRDILKLIFAQGMRPLFIGLLIGLPCAFAAMRLLRQAFVGVTPADPVTFIFVIALLITAGGLGCAIPARRATRVDPVIALRCQ